MIAAAQVVGSGAMNPFARVMAMKNNLARTLARQSVAATDQHAADLRARRVITRESVSAAKRQQTASSPIPIQGTTSPAIRAAARRNAMRAEYLRLISQT